MKYFLLNINESKINQVDYWIDRREFAPIFYKQSTIEQIRSRTAEKRNKDAERFVSTFENINNDTLIVSKGESYFYFYKQKSELLELEQHIKKDKSQHLVKGFYIKEKRKYLIKNCPLVLGTIKSNTYLTMGTFREINSKNRNSSYFGNILAIKYVMTDEKQIVNNFAEYLFCLSSLEFETLIAKMFEEKGYFVPAYKGGFLKDFDLFCRINNKITSLQIKLVMENDDYKENTDYFYCIINNATQINNIKNFNVIKEELNQCPKTMAWLKQSLYWVNIREK
jgi:hypothetical protein